MIRSIRFLGAALGGLVGITLVIAQYAVFQPAPGAAVLVAAWVIAWIVLGFTLLPYLTVIPAMSALRAVQQLSTAEFVTAIIGLFLGLLLGLLLGLPLSALPSPIGTVAPLGISIFLGLAMVGLTVAKRHDLITAAENLGIIRRAAPDGEAAQPRILVDTSAIIDGRIADIADSGFLFGILEVPRFVLDEVQRLADSSDSLRRTRGRRGLEILARMRKSGATPVQVIDEDVPGTSEVDSKLVALAKRNGRAVLTNDLNLNRIADLQGVRVLNVNSLANAVKPALLPGEDLRVRVIQPGKDAGQGVGYLDDGTMVVVEGGARSIDTELDVTVTRVLQTVAGRMVFAHPGRADRVAGIVADAVVVAAGSSERMGGGDKLAANLAGRPVLAWSLAALAASPVVERIALVRTAAQAAQPRPDWLPDKVVAVVAGGARRQDSVAAGIRALDGDRVRGDGGDASDGDRVLLVHDGARPLVSPRLVDAVARAAAEHGAAIPVMPVAETLKRVHDGTVTETIDRTGAVTAQTPQGVRWDVYRGAASRIGSGDARELTDEAALLEAAGVAVHVVPGEAANLKITRPEDLALAESRLGGATATRTGIGSDVHPFGPGEGLRLGGVEIPGAPRLHGHSDGDVALHAIASALLGAVALGDLGGLHPADARTPRGIASAELLRSVREALATNGWQPVSIDLSIRAGRPWLAGHMPEMRRAIAGLLDLDLAAVSVKASTGNLSGDVGAGRTIEAEALATVSRLEQDR